MSSSVGAGENLLIKIDGEPAFARSGDTVAAAMLRAGITTFTRSIKYHRPRGAFCLDGSCGQCLVRIDGVPSVMACRAQVRPGLRCERQNAPLGSADTDLIRAVDFVFPGGLDHHHIATFSKVAGQVALQVARTLAGLGHLPDQPLQPVPAKVVEAEVAIVGGGPAGLSAALGAVGSDRRGVILIERDEVIGGAALLQLDPAGPRSEQLDELLKAVKQAGAQVWTGSEVVGLYPPEGQAVTRALLAVRGAEGLTLVHARRVIVACGGLSQPAIFAGVDRPGVYAARGLLALAHRHGVLVGAPRGAAGSSPAPDSSAPPAGGSASSAAARPKLAVVGEGAELANAAAALGRAGYEIVLQADASAVHRVRGNPVREVQLTEGGRVRKIRCDAVAIALPPAPFHELATSCGAAAPFDAAQGGFPVQADANGRTRVPWLFVAGRVAGRAGEGAIASGRAAGQAAASDLETAAAALDPAATSSAAAQAAEATRG